MTVLSVSDVSLSFGVREILSHISFSLNENDKLGIVGVNGCGKSTLFKVITGELTPDEGKVFISGGKSVGILRQDEAFEMDKNGGDSALSQMIAAFPELLAAEDELKEIEARLHEAENDPSLATLYDEKRIAFERAGGLEFRSRAAGILLRMGFDEVSMRGPLAALSGGQRTRLSLSRQLAREPDILLLDEPTNHLDMETMTFLENFLIQYRKCVLVISHDRYFLDRVTGKTLVLQYAHATLYNGGYTASAEKRRTDREIAERHYRNQQKEIARQEAYIAQQRAFNRERNIIAAESRLKLLAKMEKFEKPKDDPRGIRLSFKEAGASGNEVLSVRHLSMSFPGRTLFSDISFLIKKGERVLLLGQNGCGKSTLLKLILGKITPSGGRVEMGYHVEIGYYDQENQNLTPENTVLEELWSAYPQLSETEIRTTLSRFCFTGEDVFRTVSVLSGGERARLTLSKLILSHVNFLVLDEPTNHLDIDSREALEEALLAFDGTVLAVSHDRYFIEKLATRVLYIARNAPDGDLLDDRISKPGEAYTEFMAFKEKRMAGTGSSKETAPPPSENKAQYLARKESKADERREKSKVQRLKNEAEAIEKELDEIGAALFGEAATDYKKAAELDSRKSALEERLLEIYEQIGV